MAAHRVIRVARDEQWAGGTTSEQYVSDLHAAVEDDFTRIAIGRPEGSQPLVYVFADTERVAPERRRGAQTLPLVFVLYGVDTGVIITGYQVSRVEVVRVPLDLRWLK